MKKHVLYMVSILTFTAGTLQAADTRAIPDTHAIVAPVSTPTSGTHISITRAAIAKSGANTLSDVLQNQAGITLYNATANTAAPSISLRGFGENSFANTLVLVNGFPLENPDMASSYLNSIPLSDVDHIDIVPSSGGILYGDSAVGGLINIITREPKTLEGTLSESVGSYNELKTAATVGQTLANGFNYFFSGSTAKNSGYRQYDDNQQSHALAQLGYRYASGSVRLHYQIFNLAQTFPGALISGESPTLGTPGQQAHTQADMGSLQFNQTLTANWRLESQVAERNEYTHGTLYSDFYQHRHIKSFMPRFLGVLPYDHILTNAGFEFKRDQYDYTMPLLPSENIDNDDHTQSAYTHFKIPLVPHYAATLGARVATHQTTLNQENAHDHVWVTEQGVVYEPAPQWRFYARRAGNYRFPKADEAMTPTGIQFLKTQTGVAYEIGLHWQQNKTSLELSLYQLDIQNEIAYSPPANDPTSFGTNTNLDPTRRQGFIVHHQLGLTQNWLMYADYNYVKATLTAGAFKHKRIPFVAENSGRLGTSYEFLEHYTVYTDADYTGGRYPSEDNNNTTYFGGYTTYNTSVQYHQSAWHFSVRVNNVFDKRYDNYTLFVPSTPNSIVYVYPANGRQYLMTLEYHFHE